tara:strand:- start:245 stop:634 length:390 start_codon:yes stop_codon:yes gene_type:complete
MAKNPKIHTVTCKYVHGTDGDGSTSATTALADSGKIPKGAGILRATVLTHTAIAGSGGGLELYAEGTDASGSVKIATYAAAATDAIGDAVPGAVTGGVITEESDFAIKMVTAVATAGDLTFVVEYIMGN